jgi:26S proteasome regulatory subunit N5
VRADAARRAEALSHAVLFLCLAPHSETQTGLLRAAKANRHVADELPALAALATAFTTPEIIAWPLPEAVRGALEAHPVFAARPEWAELLQQRAVQHSLRVVARSYSRVRLGRLAELLALPVARVEAELSELVAGGALYARIDRPAGVVSFERPRPAADIASTWAADVDTLLALVERTTHLIQREHMVHAHRAAAAAAAGEAGGAVAAE